MQNPLVSPIDEDQIDLRQKIIGIHQEVPLLDGSMRTYVNLDNAASTPAFRHVFEKTEEMAVWYSSVHRGTGFKSMLSTQVYDDARRIIIDFVGADRELDCVIFCKNATEALNKLARRFHFQQGYMVLTTAMEHHSNDLPWRAAAGVVHAGLLPDGELDMEDFRQKMRDFSGRIKLVAVTGASNVTGFMPPIYEMAELAHEHGAKIAIDCAQLIPHRIIDMLPHDSARHLDFIAFSAHKIYAPYGSGALIGAKEFFNEGEPDARGGGTVEIVTLDEVAWTEAPERDEAGSPNVIGAVALAASLKYLSEIGMENIVRHEADLTRYALSGLAKIPGIKVYGSTNIDEVEKRVGVIPFNMENIAHGKLAAILGYEGGVSVRNGCFCAHPYILHLLRVTEKTYRQYHERVLHHDRSGLPGLVRMSFGCYNNYHDLDRLFEMLERISRGDFIGEYVVDERSGSYYPRDFDLEAQREKFFSF